MKGFASLVFALVALPLLAGIAIVACYDTTIKTPPCTVGGEGCLPPIHDSKRPDGGLK